ncbi:hypothetical protein JCM16303_001383 [Sporobolomyces ruberrimus]
MYNVAALAEEDDVMDCCFVQLKELEDFVKTWMRFLKKHPKYANKLKEIKNDGLAIGSPLFDQASVSLSIPFDQDQGFFPSNVQIDIQSATKGLDSASKSAKDMVGSKILGGIAFKSMWKPDKEGMLVFSSSGGQAAGCVCKLGVILTNLEGLIGSPFSPLSSLA